MGSNDGRNSGKLYLIGAVILAAAAVLGFLKLRKASTAEATPVRDETLADKPVPLDLSPANLKAKQPPLPEPPTKK